MKTKGEQSTTPARQPSRARVQVLPGPKGLPLLGPLWEQLHDPVGWTMRTYRCYGDIVGFKAAGFHAVMMLGPDANRHVLVEAADNFLVAPLTDRLGTRWMLGEGLAVIDDPAHAQQRRLMMPAFNRRRIELYQKAMREATAEMLERWIPGAQYDLAEEMHRLTMTIVGRTLFGVDLAAGSRQLAAAVSELASTLNDPLRIAFARLPFDVPGIGLSSGGTLRRAVKTIRAQLRQIVDLHECQGGDAGDAVSMLLVARDETGDGSTSALTSAQVLDQLATLFLAGHETSANALVWAFYLLAQHPAVTRTLLDELDHQLGGRQPAAADLDNLPYLDQVVKEVLRLYPPIFAFNRTPRWPFRWKGYAIRAGVIVLYSPYVTHHMPSEFNDPETFQPERFDSVHGEAHRPYAYIPFGSGPRSCIGAGFATMELKTVLSMVLQRFRLGLVPDQTIFATVRVTLQPKYGLKMRMYKQDGRVEQSTARVRGNVIGAVPGPP